MLRLLRSTAAIVALAALASLPASAGDPDDPVTFGDVLYVGGLGELTGLSWGARGGNNYLFTCNKQGAIRVVRNGTLQGGNLDMVSPVQVGGEMGLLNIMTDVDFGGGNAFVYIFVSETASVQRLYRYAFADNAGTVSLSGKTQLGRSFPTANQNHNGGGITQDSSGRIYVGVGNNNNGINRGGWNQADEFTSLGSKVSRMNRDGSPAGAPAYLNTADGISDRDYIWARGFRNPFGLRIRPGGGNQVWMFEVGDAWEQIFHVTEDSNQGWVNGGGANGGYNENNTADTSRLLVKHSYGTGSGTGRCLTRGTFYSGTVFPLTYQGNIFFLEHNDSYIYRAPMSGDTVGARTRVVFNAANPTDIANGPDGALYYSTRGNGGEVRRLYYNGSTPTVINTHPQNQTVAEGAAATFSVSATGNTLSYQWQLSTDGGANFNNITGAMAASYNTGATTLAMNGRRYRVVVTGTGGSVTSNSATLTVNPVPPTVTGQPGNQTVVEGSMATFSATASGSAPLTYQWQLSTDNGATWNNVGGATATSYMTAATTLAMNGYRYRVVVDNGAPGTVNSNSATLTVNSAATAPVITQAPIAQTVTAPATATFSVSAGGTAPLSYQWQRSINGGTNWTNVGTSQTTYTTPATTTGMTGELYRVVVTNSLGSATSAAAVLTVNGPPAATPVIVPNGGIYTGPVTVRLATASAGAEIRYTTNGTTPGAGSTLYAGPFVVSANATVQARAMGTGFSQSAVASAVFNVNGATPYGLAYRDVLTGITIPPQQSGLPTTLTGTGLFTNLGTLAPATGMIPFDVNSPLWSDGAAKSRWVGLPGASQIVFSATADWTFPGGTVLVKHFELQTSPGVFRRVETRVLRTDGAGSGYGSTYRWRLDGSDADLVTTAATEVINVGGTNQTWYYPSAADCLRCHTTAAGFVLGPKTRQLNRSYGYPGGTSDNQIRTWSYLDMFTTRPTDAQIAGFQRLRALTDVSATLEDRVKSYLDSNCAHCHRGPATPAGRAQFDGRYATPMASQGVVDAAPLADTLGIANARVVAPQDVGRSLMHSRMQRTDLNRMPPLASSVPDPEALITFEAWINTLSVTPPPVAITAAPTTQSVTAGQPATFSVNATGAPPLSYQWQQSLNGGTTWTNIPGATGPTYTTGATGVGMNGTLIRVVVTDGTGATATSGAATLNVAPAPPPPPPPVAVPAGDLGEGVDEKCLGGLAAAAPGAGAPWLLALLALVFAYRGRWSRR